MYFKLALGNVKKSIRDYGIYFLTLVFGVCVFYAFNSITQQGTVLQMSETQNQIISLLANIIGGVSVFIAVILGFLIVYASRYLIRRRKQEFGTYLLLGMSPGKVSRIIVYETLFVGVLSLAVGLIAGILLSQALLYITAALFSVTMDMFVFIISWEAFAKTILYFGVIFVIALIFNAVTVSRYKLIDLINANKKNEDFKLRSLALSVVLFIVSVVLIGIAYALLIDGGLEVLDMQFLASTITVCVGTLLLFFSVAGFLLRAVQANKKRYLRGLNMFTLRQLSAKINTAFASITLVCMALFLAITATCGGFAMCTAFTSDLESTTRYDASLRASYGDRAESTPAGAVPWYDKAIADGFDMKATLSRDISNWDDVVKEAVQVNFYTSETSFQFIFDAVDSSVNTNLGMYTSEDSYLYLVPLSDHNALRALTGLEPIELASDEYVLWSDVNDFMEVYSNFLEQDVALTIGQTSLFPASAELETVLTETSSVAMNTGTIVVPDEIISESLLPYHSVLNIMYNGNREEVEPLFIQALNDAYLELWTVDTTQIGWPYMGEFTAVEVNDQSIGLSFVISYLAIYIGFILLITCAAILALQQLSEAADNVARYGMLQKLGASEGMVNKALLVQIGVYFVFPLIIALCHSFVALSVVVDLISVYGNSDIFGPLLITIVLFVVVYGGYFLLTYFAARGMINKAPRALTT